MRQSFLFAALLAAAVVNTTATPNQQAINATPLSDPETRRPNVVFILTDDQDVHLDSLEYMPLVRRHLIEKGTQFTKHYCTTAICCPSRVTLWTGKAAHNTNVTDVSPPYGKHGLSPTQLKEFLLDPHTYDYMNSVFQRNKLPPVSHKGEYSTDVLTQKAYGLLEEAVKADKPFFLTLAPIGPHSNINAQDLLTLPFGGVVFEAPIPAKRHENLFQDVKVPRTENFNPDSPSGANWIRELGQLNETNLEYNDHFYRSRLRALQAVDELVEGVIAKLEEHGILDNTYIVYSSDNGFHIGQHRLQPGKTCGYEEDINVPLIIRGPGIAANLTTDVVSTHTDLAPTFFELLGIPLRDDFDGTPIPLTEEAITEVKSSGTRREHVGVEYWGLAGSEGIYESGLVGPRNNTYKSIRLYGEGYNLYYSTWCSNEHELYNLNDDPGQLHNLLFEEDGPKPTEKPLLLLGYPVSKVVARLDTLLFVLKSCKGQVCVNPWETLHPEGDVHTLHDALSASFDNFYEIEQTRVSFTSCEPGYIISAEGPQFDHDGLIFRDGLSWDQWT
ncbi:hypothetical protein V496_01732 [Pseudogymnoascus sp. VKM F-4515 (FW-2607)]|nr:hypothetical protein V496_01732 [Pseudogymnoascus sp. VKM F-4515 (FW-2607)]KFY92846.1 hypothetical protein V498_04723 [Pseudogymnoascus sp. VKM F-4517 (FW-2822)]